MPEHLDVDVPSQGTIADLRAAVSKLRPNLNTERLRICDVWSNRVYKVSEREREHVCVQTILR
jgi:hypothetical protein